MGQSFRTSSLADRILFLHEKSAAHYSPLMIKLVSDSRCFQLQRHPLNNTNWLQRFCYAANKTSGHEDEMWWRLTLCAVVLCSVVEWRKKYLRTSLNINTCGQRFYKKKKKCFLEAVITCSSPRSSVDQPQLQRHPHLILLLLIQSMHVCVA